MAVDIYSKINSITFTRISLNLSNESIERGDWINSNLLDTYFNLEKRAYPDVKLALKIATRGIRSNENRIFSEERWIFEEEANPELKKYEKGLRKSRRRRQRKYDMNEMTTDYLKLVQSVMDKNWLLNKGITPENGSNHIGWYDEKSYFFIPQKLKDFVMEIDGRLYENIEDIHAILVEEKILKQSKEKKTGRAREDMKVTLYHDENGIRANPLVWTFNKAKMQELLRESQSI